MKKPFEYTKPSTYRTAIVDDNTGSIHFNTANVRPDTEAATDVSVYIEALSQALDEHLNSDEWRQAAMEATPCEFRPAGAEATGQQIVTLAERTVSFDPRKNWDNQTIEKGEVLAGSMIFTETTDAALLISHRVTILDHNLQAGFTENSMAQTGEKMLLDIQYSAASNVANILATARSTETVTESKPTGKPLEVAEDLIDILTMHINQTVGSSLSDFVILMPLALKATLERAVQRAGLASIEELLGAGVQLYSGTDRGMFLLPKMFTSLSYRERRNGDIWKVEATRNAARQGWDLEIDATVDILANGKVKVALTEDGLQTTQVDYPMITRIVLTTAVTGVSLKNASKELTVGDSYRNTATVTPADATNKDVTWVSFDSSVASVDADGNVKALKAGTATVTAKTVDGGFTASYDVQVKAVTKAANKAS